MEGDLSVFHFKHSLGIRLEWNWKSNFFQKDSNWKILEGNYGTDNKRR